MDPPSKKRSIFGFTGLFRSSPAPTDERDRKTDSSVKAAAPAPAQRDLNHGADAPHSPMKRASESQLASRKMISRPHGPSSKLSQSISASDIAHRPSSMALTTPRRMPGDNPNKPPPSFPTSAASHAAENIPKATSFSGVTSTPRNIFRSSALYSRPATSNFSPRVPTNTLTQSFPPTTPGRPPRGSTADVNGRILSNTSSTELFKMRIPSPPRHLTGEMLAKEVPEDPNRAGSIYADEFLAHYCPPEFDEHQRRQFFCILDLRRLKYAADEVFARKDWKINILNFAKEYEKSRSLIMLRYGLYEFKTVRASEAVKKEWKQKHGIPDSDDESDIPRTNGGAKRKAEEDLEPTDSALATSASGGNKRARAPEASTKNKRKAEVEPDEIHPAKLQRPASTPQKPPSATKSVFESIANNAQSSPSSTAAKNATKGGLFSSAAGPNGSLGRSALDTASKPAATAGNIFGHLSEQSKGSGNEGADEESETSSNGEEGQSDAQEAGKDDEPVASGGASTLQFGDAKKATVNGTSSAPSDAGDSTQGRSIFERITRGSDGQPIRKLAPGDGNIFAAPAVKDRSASPVKEQPTNNTWNANTPIKFAAPSGSLFGANAPKPASSSTFDFGAPAAKKPEEAKKAEEDKKAEEQAAPAAREPSKDSAPQNIFGAQTKKTEEVAGSSGEATKATGGNLFSFPPKPADAPAPAPSIFGVPKPSTSTSTSLFGSSTPASDQPKPQDEAKDSGTTPAAPASSTLFGAQPTNGSSEASKPSIFQSSTLFGSQTKPESKPAAQPQFGGLFGGKPQTTEAQSEKPAPSLFSTDSAKPTSNIFGASTAPAGNSSEEPAAKKFVFGSSENKSGSSLFGSATPAPSGEAAKPTGTTSIFGASSTPAASSTGTGNIFGTANTPAAPATETKNLFGAANTSAAPATESKNIFAATTPAAPASETKSLFGAASTSAAASTENKSIFGATTSAPSQETKPLFSNAAGTTEAKPAGLFANATTTAPAASTTPIFNFGASTPASSQPATTQPSGSIFGTGGSASFTFSAGITDGTIKNPFATDGSNSAPPSFDFGSGGSQSSNTPFTFGAGSTPTFSFGGTSDAGASGTQQSTSSGPATGSIFNFGASSQPSPFSQNPPAASSIFASSLAPGGGTSTGTSE